MLVGYTRVSTLDLQRDALTKAGCERLTMLWPTCFAETP